MAPERSSLDVIALETSEEMVGIILQFNKKIPELELFEASPIDKTYYKTMVRDQLPSAGFRLVGQGMQRDLGRLRQRVVQCGYLDASWAADEAFFTGSEWGSLETEQQAASLLSAFKAWQQRIWNGADDIDVSGGFPGLCSLFPYKDSPGVVDAAGTTALTASSVYYGKTGTQDLCVAWGNYGEIAASDIFPAIKRDAESREYNARAQTVAGWAGLQIVNHLSAVRICNITADSTHTLTDGLLNQARFVFTQQYGVMPDFCAMSYRSLLQLQNSRTSFNPLGTPAVVPTEDTAHVPIVATLGLTQTEAILGATPAGLPAAPADEPDQVEGAGGDQRAPAQP